LERLLVRRASTMTPAIPYQRQQQMQVRQVAASTTVAHSCQRKPVQVLEKEEEVENGLYEFAMDFIHCYVNICTLVENVFI
jgi:hypothetical protein